MTLEALSVLIYGLAIFVAVLFQASYLGVSSGLAYGFSNRETDPPNSSPLGNRLNMLLGNLKEGGAMYIPLALLAVFFEISNDWTYYAALTTILSRLAYIPIVIMGIPVVRTLVWTPSFLAVPAMAYGIYQAMGA